MGVYLKLRSEQERAPFPSMRAVVKDGCHRLPFLCAHVTPPIRRWNLSYLPLNLGSPPLEFELAAYGGSEVG